MHAQECPLESGTRVMPDKMKGYGDLYPETGFIGRSPREG
jgi:hypothetical protein